MDHWRDEEVYDRGLEDVISIISCKNGISSSKTHSYLKHKSVTLKIFDLERQSKVYAFEVFFLNLIKQLRLTCLEETDSCLFPCIPRIHLNLQSEQSIGKIFRTEKISIHKNVLRQMPYYATGFIIQSIGVGPQSLREFILSCRKKPNYPHQFAFIVTTLLLTVLHTSQMGMNLRLNNLTQENIRISCSGEPIDKKRLLKVLGVDGEPIYLLAPGNTLVFLQDFDLSSIEGVSATQPDQFSSNIRGISGQASPSYDLFLLLNTFYIILMEVNLVLGQPLEYCENDLVHQIQKMVPPCFLGVGLPVGGGSRSGISLDFPDWLTSQKYATIVDGHPSLFGQFLRSHVLDDINKKGSHRCSHLFEEDSIKAEEIRTYLDKPELDEMMVSGKISFTPQPFTKENVLEIIRSFMELKMISKFFVPKDYYGSRAYTTTSMSFRREIKHRQPFHSNRSRSPVREVQLREPSPERGRERSQKRRIESPAPAQERRGVAADQEEEGEEPADTRYPLHSPKRKKRDISPEPPQTSRQSKGDQEEEILDWDEYKSD